MQTLINNTLETTEEILHILVSMLSPDHVRLMRGHLVAGLVLSLPLVYIVGKIYVRARSLFNKVILVKEAFAASPCDVGAIARGGLEIF